MVLMKVKRICYCNILKMEVPFIRFFQHWDWSLPWVTNFSFILHMISNIWIKQKKISFNKVAQRSSIVISTISIDQIFCILLLSNILQSCWFFIQVYILVDFHIRSILKFISNNVYDHQVRFECGRTCSVNESRFIALVPIEHITYKTCADIFCMAKFLIR